MGGLSENSVRQFQVGESSLREVARRRGRLEPTLCAGDRGQCRGGGLVGFRTSGSGSHAQNERCEGEGLADISSFRRIISSSGSDSEQVERDSKSLCHVANLIDG